MGLLNVLLQSVQITPGFQTLLLSKDIILDQSHNEIRCSPSKKDLLPPLPTHFCLIEEIAVSVSEDEAGGNNQSELASSRH